MRALPRSCNGVIFERIERLQSRRTGAVGNKRHSKTPPLFVSARSNAFPLHDNKRHGSARSERPGLPALRSVTVNKGWPLSMQNGSSAGWAGCLEPGDGSVAVRGVAARGAISGVHEYAATPIPTPGCWTISGPAPGIAENRPRTSTHGCPGEWTSSASKNSAGRPSAGKALASTRRRQPTTSLPRPFHWQPSSRLVPGPSGPIARDPYHLAPPH